MQSTAKAKQWFVTQCVHKDVLEKLHCHFLHLQIPYMPIKGAYLISTNLAEKMHSRITHDIDILVPSETLETVTAYFSTCPHFTLLVHYNHNYRSRESVFQYTIHGLNVIIEFQNQINTSDRFLLETDALFNRALHQKGMLFFPSIEDSLLIFLCHLQSHIPFEFKPTTLEEMHLLLQQNNFSWDSFHTLCLKTGMTGFIRFMFVLYRKKYTLPKDLYSNAWYANLLAERFSVSWYTDFPLWLRRALLDLPFVRRPLGLVFYKSIKNITNKKVMSHVSKKRN